MEFVDREWELATLDRLWAAQSSQFLILYGRRRTGKTRLLTHWLQTRQARTIYWVAKPTSAVALLRSFSQAIYNYAHPQASVDLDFGYPSWEMALAQVRELASSKRLALIIDEFTYAMEAAPDLGGTLQIAWDQGLKDANLFLTLSGSHVGMMEQDVLAYRAPLYGRATSRLWLQPLPFRALAAFFPHYDATERVAVYAILGGIPAYLERFSPSLSVSQNILEAVLTPTNLMQEEPRLLLQEQLAEPRNYMAILEALAHSYRTPTRIATSTGLAASHVGKYLSVLQSLRLVRRDVPVTVRHAERSRKGRYVITDPYLRFYFRFLARRQDEIALGRIQYTLQEIQRHLIDFIDTYTFEELCRDWVSVQGDAGRLPFVPERVGSHWSRDAQVDVVAIQWMDKAILLGEAKWSRDPVGRDVIAKLIAQKTPRVLQALPDQGAGWHVHYAFFARAGFTEAAQVEAERANAILVDLERLDRDLEAVRPSGRR
jgi:AAA+ ATPase superfamily predicted ATPase